MCEHFALTRHIQYPAPSLSAHAPTGADLMDFPIMRLTSFNTAIQQWLQNNAQRLGEVSISCCHMAVL